MRSLENKASEMQKLTVLQNFRWLWGKEKRLRDKEEEDAVSCSGE